MDDLAFKRKVDFEYLRKIYDEQIFIIKRLCRVKVSFLNKQKTKIIKRFNGRRGRDVISNFIISFLFCFAKQQCESVHNATHVQQKG